MFGILMSCLFGVSLDISGGVDNDDFGAACRVVQWHELKLDIPESVRKEGVRRRFYYLKFLRSTVTDICAP